ncbi:MarC family protein [Rhodoligotrophos defluvii]|uniref:MarC family protein n=1 Tax=Rhodoligotrophos defluvii TaxID=2561934 RepID=UPI0010C98C6D|nr:MarC family protein [Rhodoligotrophos defluvii]
MIPDLALFITQFTTLWIMLDPVGHLPLFLGATGALTTRERRVAAVYAAFFAFLILVFFGFAGQALLHAMGVSLLAFQIAGGLILLLFSLTMVLGAETAPSAVPTDSVANPISLAVYPLATPIMAGPGAILTMVLLMDNNRLSFIEQMETIGALASVLVILAMAFLAGELIIRVIGQAGIQIARRVMGMILAAVAVNLIVTAFQRWLSLPPI